jgi:hypothetical protein
MKPKFHVILEQAVEQGVSYGYRRAHKHVENPSEVLSVSTLRNR